MLHEPFATEPIIHSVLLIRKSRGGRLDIDLIGPLCCQ